jgi:protein-serine/threonine kinase
MTVPDASETAEGEGPDGSDKPPHDDISLTRSHNKSSTTQMNGLRQSEVPNGQKRVPTRTAASTAHGSVPLPPPEEGSYPKEPGHTRPALESLVLSANAVANGNKTPSTPSTPTFSETESESRPSTRAPSQAPSRAASFSAGVSGGKVTAPSPKPAKGTVAPPVPHPGERRVAAHPMKGKTASVHSDGGGHKFHLKDLKDMLSSGPKIARKSSQRSSGSKRSDSDSGAKSVGGDSAASLSKKYGVCQKVAIGKGATSVVRLAHKWDRSEERLYAVKVRWPAFIQPHAPESSKFHRSSERDERMSLRRNTSRSSLQSFAFLLPYTTPTS